MDLSTVEWTSPEWIQQHGLRTDNLFDYLSESPFWDRTCNNQLIKQQENHPQLFTFNETARHMNGNYYELVHTDNQSLWIVNYSDNFGNVLSTIVVVGAKVSLSPNVYGCLVQNLLALEENLHTL